MEQELGMSLTDIHMSVSRAFHAMNNSTRSCARQLGLGQGQPRILSYIAVNGVSTQREIARFYGIDPSGVSRLLDPLERNGFLRSVPGRDRRARALDLTDAGRAALASWERECRRVDQIMVQGMTDDEATQLKDLLERARQNLVAAQEEKADGVVSNAAATLTAAGNGEEATHE